MKEEAKQQQEEEFLPEPTDEIIENSHCYSEELIDDVIEEVNLRGDLELCSVMFGFYVLGIHALSSFGFSKKELIQEIDNHFEEQ